MSTLDQTALGADLDFIIDETGKDLVGVSPPAIAGLTFRGAFSSLEDGYEVELAGREVQLDGEFVINGSAYTTLPTKGAVLKELDDTHHKIFEVPREAVGPAYRLQVISRYGAGG